MAKVKKAKKTQLEKAHTFIRKHGFYTVPHDQDNFLAACKFCNKKGWLPEDVEHKNGCEIGDLFEE